MCNIYILCISNKTNSSNVGGIDFSISKIIDDFCNVNSTLLDDKSLTLDLPMVTNTMI